MSGKCSLSQDGNLPVKITIAVSSSNGVKALDFI